METTNIKLEKLKFIIMESFTKEYVESVDFSLHNSFITDNIRMRVKGFVWAEVDSAKYQEIKYPCNWWEAFKERWFYNWMLKKWPVKYKITIIDVRSIYPTLKAEMPDHQRVLTIIRVDKIDVTEEI